MARGCWHFYGFVIDRPLTGSLISWCEFFRRIYLFVRGAGAFLKIMNFKLRRPEAVVFSILILNHPILETNTVHVIHSLLMCIGTLTNPFTSSIFFNVSRSPNSYLGPMSAKTTLARNVTTRGVVIISNCKLFSSSSRCPKPLRWTLSNSSMDPPNGQIVGEATSSVAEGHSHLLYWWGL